MNNPASVLRRAGYAFQRQENNEMIDKKILHVYSSWTAGGAEKVMLSIVRELQKKGLDNIILCPRDSYLFEQAKASGIKAWP